jgi:Leucine-rich repeat (LRR) protein
LEIESNFFTGALPFLEQMTELTYVYLRRNNLSSHLNFLKGRRLTNLFSIWLDGNDITQTIPTQIGELTTLASISITNASLTGTIPTELAILPLLNRIWLYGNDLNGTVPEALANITKLEILEIQDNNITGTMPEGVCENIRKSEYENKALVVDCDEVKCNDCCTRCV